MSKLRKKINEWKNGPEAIYALMFITFLDCIILPTPPFLILFPLYLMRPKDSFRNSLIVIIVSMVASLIAYSIGWWFYLSVAEPIIKTLGFYNSFLKFKSYYSMYGAPSIFLWCLTPLPLKIVTLTSGIVHMPIHIFFSTLLLGCCTRYFTLATLFYFYGDKVQILLNKYKKPINYTVLFLIIVVVLYGLAIHY